MKNVGVIHKMNPPVGLKPPVLFFGEPQSLSRFNDSAFQSRYRAIFLSDYAQPSKEPIPVPSSVAAVVVEGYSELVVSRRLPEAERILRQLSPATPRLFLMSESSPTLEPDPMGKNQQSLILRGPAGSGRLIMALNRLLAPANRARRFDLEATLKIGTRFSLAGRHHDQTFYRGVLEIGPVGMSFLWSREAPPIFPGDHLTNLTLFARGKPFFTTQGEVRNLAPVRDEQGRSTLRVGVHFLFNQQSTEAQHASGRLQGGGNQLTDIGLVRAVLGEVRDSGETLSIVPETRGDTYAATVERLDTTEHGNLLFMALSEAPPPDQFLPMDIITGQFIRDNAQLHFSTVLLAQDGPLLTLRLPRRLEQLWSRSKLRYPPPSDANMFVDVETPIQAGPPMNRRLLDLSPDGMSFLADPKKDLLLPGMQLGSIRLHLDGIDPIETRGEVRHLGQPQEGVGKGVPCGVQFREMDLTTQTRLVDYLIAKSFPHVGDVTPKEAQPLWRFLLRTNYLSEKKRQVQLFPEVLIRRTHSTLLAAPRDVSRTLVFRDDSGDICGTVTLTRIYERTWLVHHLAATLKVSVMVPKSLLLYLGEYISKTPDIEFVRMMWRPNNTWSNRMLGRLIHRLHTQETSAVKLLNYLDAPLQGGEFPEPDNLSKWEVRPMDHGEEVELEACLIFSDNHFLLQSDDLHRGDPTLTSLGRAYADSGMERRREVLVAVDENGVVGGFALLEMGSPGLNLSNLLHAFRIEITSHGTQDRLDLTQSLAASAAERYQELGQNRVVALVEDHDVDALKSMGFQWQKEYISWTFGQDIASLYNLYCHYVFRVYERLERRLARRRQREKLSSQTMSL